MSADFFGARERAKWRPPFWGDEPVDPCRLRAGSPEPCFAAMRSGMPEESSRSPRNRSSFEGGSLPSKVTEDAEDCSRCARCRLHDSPAAFGYRPRPSRAPTRSHGPRGNAVFDAPRRFPTPPHRSFPASINAPMSRTRTRSDGLRGNAVFDAPRRLPTPPHRSFPASINATISRELVPMVPVGMPSSTLRVVCHRPLTSRSSHQQRLHPRIVPGARVSPVRRIAHVTSLHWVVVDVFQLLSQHFLGLDDLRVAPFLPELKGTIGLVPGLVVVQSIEQRRVRRRSLR